MKDMFEAMRFTLDSCFHFTRFLAICLAESSSYFEAIASGN